MKRVLDMHGEPLSPGDRIYLPSIKNGRSKTGRAMGDEAVVVSVEPGQRGNESYVRFVRLGEQAVGELWAKAVRLRRHGQRRARRRKSR